MPRAFAAIDLNQGDADAVFDDVIVNAVCCSVTMKGTNKWM
jgi:hypothetical protein